MIRLSVPLRQVLSRLTLPVMLLLSLGMILVGRADQNLGDRLRVALDDALAPAYQLVAGPVEALQTGTGAIGHLFTLAHDNAYLRSQNAKLLQWQAVAMALEAQNTELSAELNYTPPNAPAAYTGTVVADLGGVYARSVLAVTPPGAPGLLGAVAMDGRGVAGRVVEAGARSVRILLITDLNSRIPVALGAHGTAALMTGTNDADPALVYWDSSHPPAEGDIVLTSAIGGAFPPGLPVGIVHYDTENTPVVLPLADLDDLRLLRLFAYPVVTPALTPMPAKTLKTR